jgi:hypothetical protein
MIASEGGLSFTCAVWQTGYARKSLFANLPGCRCPIIQVEEGGNRIAGIPADWNHERPFTRDELEAFSRVQLERRLCALFLHNVCEGCPVATAAGYAYCGNTPYADWRKWAGGRGYTGDTPDRKRVAQAELDFLIGLLPEKRKKQ